MTTQTLQTRLLVALESHGCKLVAKGRKYWKVSGNVGTGYFFFLGASGALRYGRTQSDSVSWTDTTTYNMLLFGQTSPRLAQTLS